MAQRIEVSYRIEPGEHNTKRLVQFGRCDSSAATIAQIESGVSIGRLIRLPNSTGTVFKTLDGTAPELTAIKPPTMFKTFQCVKVSGRVWPFAPLQNGGVFRGSAVCRYEIVWQESGGVA